MVLFSSTLFRSSNVELLVNKSETGEPLKAQALKVFISYSRSDMSFADELVAGLEYDGRFDVTIDRHSILEGEDWKLRLGTLIADADTVVFIISHASAKSDICAWEVDEALRHSKRILPVLAESIGTIPVPKKLAALNYVRFDAFDDGRPRSFMAGLNALVRAINTDAAWLHEHTRYLSLARSWDEAGQATNRLLSGSDIFAAKTWAARRPKDAPQLTELHLDFIRASEEAEAARASKERQQLDEIKAAQMARAEALTQEERVTRRLYWRTVTLGGAATLLGVLLVGGMWLYASDQNRQAGIQRRLAEKLQAETARADKFINLVSSNPAGHRAMEKICLEAIQVTSVLATTSDESENKLAMDRFWELYFGPMYIVETHQAKNSPTGHSQIESSMVNFGNRRGETIATSDLLPQKSLCSSAKDVRDKCIAYLKVSAPEPCT
jgi:hypothetical protein